MKGCDKLVDAGRRQFLRGSVLATAGVAATTVLPADKAAPNPILRGLTILRTESAMFRN